MSGSQSRAKGSSIALVLPVEYSTASWRRALLSLEDHQKAWLLWNYSDNIRWEHRGDDHPVGMGAIQRKLAGVRIAKQSVACVNSSGWPLKIQSRK